MDSVTAFRNYLELEKKYSPHTVTAYLRDISFFTAFLKSEFENHPIEEVNYSMIRSWLVSLSDSNLSNTAINRKIASLKAFYKFLLKIQRITISPLLKHKALKTPKKIQIPFSENELEAVLNGMYFADDFEGIRNKLIIDLFYATGMRRSELIHLKLHDVDVQKGTLKVLGKRNKERIVPILPSVAETIRKYLRERAALESIKDSDYFFVVLKGVKLSETFVYRLINSYFSEVSAKVKKSPHILRHTFATHMLNHGADLNSVKELLGHSSLASTQVYTHSSLAELKKVYGDAHPRNRS